MTGRGETYLDWPAAQWCSSCVPVHGTAVYKVVGQTAGAMVQAAGHESVYMCGPCGRFQFLHPGAYGSVHARQGLSAMALNYFGG
jgi:hypothetical protein